MHDLAALGPTARIIDVREPQEWDAGHIAHAELVPLGSVPERLDAFAATPTYVVCRSGNRSGRACEFLGAQGLEVVNVAGGMLAWVDAGFDIECRRRLRCHAVADPRLEYRWIDRQVDFDEIVTTLLDQPRYALDTEFHRERTYYPKLALVQVAWRSDDGQQVALIDPLAVDVGSSSTSCSHRNRCA